MHIATLAQVYAADTLYRCDALPAQRAAVLFNGSWRYVRPDGSMEPFEFRVEADKYRYDETWRAVGVLTRLAPDGRIDLAQLAKVLTAAEVA